VPSGLNTEKKLALLKDEGVKFDSKGMLLEKASLWDDFKV
jgi:methylated-DNA-[protein]-cysteine S-methyltransferase